MDPIVSLRILLRSVLVALISLAFFPAAVVAVVDVLDGFEPDDTYLQAKPLILNAAPQQRTLHYNPPLGDVDWVSFAAVEGKSYVIQTHDLDPATTDTELELYAADGETLLSSNDDFGFSFASRIAWKAPTTGTYYVKVFGRHEGINGNYSLTLREAGSISGKVTKQGTLTPLSGITVDLWQYDQDGYYAMFETMTDSSGNYRFDAVPAGVWRVGFYDWNGFFTPKYYVNQTRVEMATDVTVAAGTSISGITIGLSPVPKTYVGVEGPNRYATAIAASKRMYPAGLGTEGQQTVILATGMNWPDALGGAVLAGALDGPILFAQRYSVPDDVMKEITRLGARKIIILGGGGAVDNVVEATLKDKLGSKNVRRIAGANRYATADAIAKEVIAVSGSEFSGGAIVTTGVNYPDALAAAPFAASGRRPIYLADPVSGLSASTRDAMSGVEEVLVLGGTKAVSTPTETYLKGRFGSGKVVRLAGSDRYDTAARIASYAVAKGMSWDGLGVATGEGFADAMSGGAMLGKRDAVMLLTPSAYLATPATAALTANADRIKTVHFFGGTSAVSNGARDAVRQALR